jgi:hypothetical protein
MGHSLSWTAVRGRSAELVLAAFELRPTGQKWDLPDRRHPFCWATLDGGWVLVLSSPLGTFDAAKALATRGRAGRGKSSGARHFDPEGAADGFSSALSVGCELVCCFVMETVMVSRAAAWKDGVQQWSVLHNPDTGGVDHLRVVGQPPSSLASIEAAARKKQQGNAPAPGRPSVARSLLGDVFEAFFSVKRRPRLRTSIPGRDGRAMRVDYLIDVPTELAKALTGFRHDESELELELLEPAQSSDAGRGPA